MSVMRDNGNVSRETLERLEAFCKLVGKWNPSINLVSKSSVDSIWERHIWDSAQLIDFQPHKRTWVDIGSGGGFPALVVSIISKELYPQRHMSMVESDQRKSAFLRTVIRELGLNAEVITQRVEEMEPLKAEVLTARALADLPLLLEYADRHLAINGAALLMKGERWEKEVDMARGKWSFDLKAHKSKTNPAAAILEIKDLQRV